KAVWYVAGAVDQIPGVDTKKVKEEVTVEALDPIRLPGQLNEWAKDKKGPQPLELVVLREEGHGEAPKRIPINFDPSFRFDREAALQPNSPLPVSGLGLAYWVQTMVDDVPDGPAKAAGVLPGDQIVAVRFKAPDESGNLKDGDWKDDLKDNQWASADTVY